METREPINKLLSINLVCACVDSSLANGIFTLCVAVILPPSAAVADATVDFNGVTFVQVGFVFVCRKYFEVLVSSVVSPIIFNNKS